MLTSAHNIAKRLEIPLTVTVDDREVSSGIVDELKERGWEVRICRLTVGDYRLGSEAVIERKTAHDFVLSVIDGRLFRQAAQLKMQGLRTAILVEGDPFQTDLDIDAQSVRGAVVSVSLIWQVPVIFSGSLWQTVDILWFMANQVHRLTHRPVARYGYRPKRLRRRQLYVLQGLPGVGPERATRLLKHFGTLRRVFQASEKEWIETEGIGKKGARLFAELLDAEFTPAERVDTNE